MQKLIKVIKALGTNNTLKVNFLGSVVKETCTVATMSIAGMSMTFELPKGNGTFEGVEASEVVLSVNGSKVLVETPEAHKERLAKKKVAHKGSGQSQSPNGSLDRI